MNDFSIDDFSSLDDSDLSIESDSILDKVKYTCIKAKKSFNKLNTNIKNKFNKDKSNNNDDESLENINHIAFYRKKPFIFWSIGLATIALLATTIPVALSLRTNSSNETVPTLKPSGPTDFVTKLKIVNNLPNNEKIKIWNEYMNQPGVLLNWSNTSHQNKILNFLKTNFDSFNNSQIIEITPQAGTPVQKNVLGMFRETIDILITKNTYYYDTAGSSYENVFLTSPQDESFLSLDSQSTGNLEIRHTTPSISIGSNWRGIPDTPNSNVGVSKQNIEFNFTLDRIDIKFPYNESYLRSNAFLSSDIPPFVYFLKNNYVSATAYYLKPINNMLSIVNSNPLFSTFTIWMENHLTTNYNY